MAVLHRFNCIVEIPQLLVLQYKAKMSLTDILEYFLSVDLHHQFLALSERQSLTLLASGDFLSSTDNHCQSWSLGILGREVTFFEPQHDTV